MSTALPLIGTINWVLDAGQKARSSEQLQQFLTIPHSFLAQLAGLIDGAWIQYLKNSTRYSKLTF